MVNVQFGTTNDDPRKLNKTFTLGTTKSCYCKEPVDVFSPVFILDYAMAYNSYNYCYVADWNKYYFINSITLSQGGKTIIQCTEDVLNTYKTEIGQLRATVERTSDLNWVDTYLDDKSARLEQYSRDFVLEFSSPFYTQNKVYVIAL